MPARAMWKGVICFGEVRVPIKLYAAVEDRKVHFRLLHAKDHAPVEQKMVHPRSGEPVPPELIRRGYEIEPGQIIFLDDAEIKALEPPESRDIRITRFIDPSQINHQWFERPYYLGPDENPQVYFGLGKALLRQGRLGIARWTMRKKSYFGALHADKQGHLMMSTLRHADAIVDVAGLQGPQFRELTRQELQMAQQLVGALADDFEASAFRDEYRERVRELVMAKASGATIELRKPEPRRPEVVSLAEMLKQSILKAKEEKKIAQAR